LDEASLLHIGDAHEAPLNVKPDILCLPWRKAPLLTSYYKKVLVRTAKQFQAPYVIPIHHDMPSTITDTSELRRRLEATLLDEKRWYSFHQHRLETD
jgi:L-ascorbate metabolism protein UlaG (beta-lactamase superfamily)